MFQKLRTIIYHVTDLDKAKQWYTQITGIQPYFDEPFYVGFDINGYELGLDPSGEGTIGGNQSVAYWAVENISAVVEKLAAAGGNIVTGVHNVGGNIEVAVVNDPFGNAIGLIEGA